MIHKFFGQVVFAVFFADTQRIHGLKTIPALHSIASGHKMHILNVPSLEEKSYILHQYERSLKKSVVAKSVTKLRNVDHWTCIQMCRILHKQDVVKYIYTEYYTQSLVNRNIHKPRYRLLTAVRTI